MPSSGDEGIEHTLAAQTLTVEPVEPGGGCAGGVGLQGDFPGAGPEVGESVASFMARGLANRRGSVTTCLSLL
jgi:hypothetical protein